MPLDENIVLSIFLALFVIVISCLILSKRRRDQHKQNAVKRTFYGEGADNTSRTADPYLPPLPSYNLFPDYKEGEKIAHFLTCAANAALFKLHFIETT